jgi:hypothetical protein
LFISLKALSKTKKLLKCTQLQLARTLPMCNLRALPELKKLDKKGGKWFYLQNNQFVALRRQTSEDQKI